jgi:tetratricopeptide (TPR) repeat protein
VALAAAVGLSLLWAAWPAAAQRAIPDLVICKGGPGEVDTRIAACGRVIDDTSRSADDRADALVARGMMEDDRNAHEKAIADYTAALALVPDEPATLILRGNAYDGKGDQASAIKDYTEAIRLNPGDAAAYYNRATSYEEIGERQNALADYKRALEIDPKYELAQKALADLTRR